MTAAEPQSKLAGRFPAFQSQDFRRLFVSGFFTAGARWAMVLGRGWLVFEMTGSATAVGAVTFAAFIPFVLVGPVAGVLADRLDRRRQIAVSMAVAIVSSAVLAALTLGGLINVWLVVALALISGSAQAVAVPAQQALIANVVDSKHLLNAVAMTGLAQHGSRVVGPLFGATLLSTVGAGYVFLLSTALLGLGLVEILRIRHRQVLAPGAAAELGLRSAVGTVREDLREGLRYVAGDRRIATVMVLVGLHCGLTMAFDSMMPTLATVVGGASTTYSAILMGIGAGAIAGTLAVSMLRTEAAQGRALALSGVGSGLAMLLLGVAPTPALLLVGAALAGATQGSFMALSAALVQRVVPDEFRGRVMAFYLMLAAGHMAFINFGFGWAADGIGVRILLVFPALIWIAIFVTAVVTLGEVRSLVRRGSFIHRPLPAAEATSGAGAAGSGGGG